MVGLISSGFLAMHYASLVSFSFITHPVGYCVLLVFNAISVCGYLFVMTGVSWYILLFCLVYVGGVYVLFIFVTVHNPNFVPMPVSSGPGLVFMVCALTLTFFYLDMVGFVLGDNSHYVCTLFEGVSYCFLCVVILVGFGCVSVVTSSKGSFFR